MRLLQETEAPAAANVAAAGNGTGEEAQGDAPVTKVELFHGDGLDGMTTLDTGSVDVVVTSPPYNLDVQYHRYRDNKPRPLYLDWCERWGREVKRVLTPHGSLFLVVSGSPTNPMLPHQLALRFSKFFVLQNEITWVKSITLDQDGHETVSRGHFKPINSTRFINDCREAVFHFTKGGDVVINRLAIGVPYGDKSNIGRWNHTAGSDLRCRGNVWFVPYQTIQNRDRQRPHPATFPPRLAEMCIKLHGHPRRRVGASRPP